MRLDTTLVDDHLRALGDRLTGPSRLKADLLAEARDSLTDAVEAYRRDGLDERAAQRRAVAEFGGPAELAPDYQTELTVGHGRRYARLILLLPIGMYTSNLLWWKPPGAAGPPPPLFLFLVGAFDLTAYAAGALALAVLLRLGPVGRRWAVEPRRLVSALARTALATSAFIWVFGNVAAARTLWETPDGITWPPMIAAWLVLNISFGLLTRSGLRLLRTVSATPVPA